MNTLTIAAETQLDDTVIPSEENYEAYNVSCSLDSFEDTETITIPVQGKHETQGLMLAPYDIYKNKVCLIAIQPGTSPRNIKQWIHCIKNAHLLQINGAPIYNVKDAKHLLSIIRNNHKQFKISVSMNQKILLHHEKGIPMLYFDQLTTIAN